MNNDTDTMQSGKGPRQSRLGRGFWILVIIAGVILGIRYFASTSNPPPSPEPEEHVGKRSVAPVEPSAKEVEDLRNRRKKELEEQRLKLETEKLRADIDARHAKFRGDVAAIVEKYRKMLPLSSAEAHFKAAEEGAQFIASREGLCGFKASASLAYKMAYDKVKNTKRAEEAISPIVQSRIVNPIEKAINVYSDWTVEFRKELQMEEQAFSLDLALRSQKFNEDISVFKAIDASKVSGSIDKLISDIREHARDSSFAVIGTAVEVAFIKSSYMAIKAIVIKVATVALSSVATKMGTTVTSATVSAVADGPLPIGDLIGGVITIAGLTWTAYDIYKVTKTMPDEMERKVMEAVAASKKALMRTGDENLETAKKASLKSADSRVKELHNLIK